MIPLPPKFPVPFRPSEGPFKELFSPNDHRLLTRVQYATGEDIDFILEKLPLAQSKMAGYQAFERANFLKEVAVKLKENAEDLALLISTEGGKPLRDAKLEVDRARSTLEICAEETLRLGGETLPMARTAAGAGHFGITLWEPIGPVLAISAFNHPLNLLAHQVGCALAAGNAVVIKPAPATPLSAFRLLAYFEEAGLRDVIFLVNAEVPEIEKLASSRIFDFVSFIGSAKVGWNLRKIIAPGTRLALEHGGQAPAIVREDADLLLAVPALIKGSFYHSGQVCISTQKIFVHHSILAQFLEEFSREARKLKVGDATKADTDVGPLIRPGEVTRISEWINEALGKGAKLVLGHEISGDQKQYLSPTILTEVPAKTKVMNEEIFGPVVCINSYSNEEELLEHLNRTEFVFESCVFTRDINAAFNWAKRLSSMTVVINNHNAFRVDWMPFGGHKLAGLGMGGVKYAIKEMARLKQIIIATHPHTPEGEKSECPGLFK